MPEILNGRGRVSIELFFQFFYMLGIFMISWKKKMFLFNNILLGTNLLEHLKVTLGKKQDDMVVKTVNLESGRSRLNSHCMSLLSSYLTCLSFVSSSLKMDTVVCYISQGCEI